MRTKLAYKLNVLITAIALMLIGITTGLVTPDTRSLSLMVTYQWGIVHIFSALLTFIGTGIFIFWIISLNVNDKRKARQRFLCPACGEAALTIKDLYCPGCGEKLQRKTVDRETR